MFPIVAVVSSIPVFSIVIKYNMLENGFSKQFGFLWGVVFPWVVGFPLLYMPNFLAQFVNFSSLVFVSFTDFIVPWALYIKLQDKRVSEKTPEAGSYLCQEEVHAQIHAHYAIPRAWGVTIGTKKRCSLLLMLVLTVAAVIATVLTIVQGSYSIDLQ